MKKLTILILVLALLLTACAGDTADPTTTAPAPSTAAPETSSSVAASTTAAPTSEPPTEASSTAPEPAATTSQLTTIARFNESADGAGMYLVSVDNIDELIVETPYDIIGKFDAESGLATALSLAGDLPRHFIINQAGQDIEPSHQYNIIFQLRPNLYCGLAADGEYYVFDASGAIYGSFTDEGRPIYNPLTASIYVNNAVYRVDDGVRQINRVQDLDAYYTEKRRLLEDEFHISYHDNEQVYSYTSGDDVQTVRDYYIFEDHAIIESELTDDASIRRYGLIGRAGETILEAAYYDIDHLVDDYYYVATNDFDELEDGYSDFRYSDIRSYKKAIYRLDKQLTEQLYFTIEHVVDDIFHVYDGTAHYFIAAESNQHVWPDVMLNGQYSFYQAGGYIVALDDPNYPRKLVIIKDGAIVARDDYRMAVSGGYVTTNYEGFATVDCSLPHVELENAAAADKINGYIAETYGQGDFNDDKDYYDFGIFNNFDIAQHDKLIQFQIDEVVNSFGAAHPGYSLYSEVFSPLDGRRYALADWFKQDVDYRQALADIMLQNEENMQRSLFYDSAMTTEEVFEMFNFDGVDYYFTADALVIYYNPYSFASFADGIIEFYIPLSDIADILNDDAKEMIL